MSSQRVQVDGDTCVSVELVAPRLAGDEWTASVASSEADEWLVTLAHGSDSDEALAALAVTLQRYGRRAPSGR